MTKSYLRELYRGQRYPYHQNPSVGIPYTELKSAAEYAALGILADLNDRHGIRCELQGIDHEVREDIVVAMAGIITEAFANFDKLKTKTLGIDCEIKD
jgi:hypothetical protein